MYSDLCIAYHNTKIGFVSTPLIQNVKYIVFPDESHGFANPRNSKRFTALAKAFLAEHLGGSAEPKHSDEDYEPFLDP